MLILITLLMFLVLMLDLMLIFVQNLQPYGKPDAVEGADSPKVDPDTVGVASGGVATIKV